MKSGKNFSIFGVRSGLIGDSIMSLPILNYLEKIYPNSYKYWMIDKKCSQASPLYLNHPLIDKILITEQNEGVGAKEIEVARSCDFIINPSPSHPYGDSWPNSRNIYEETWVMAGFPLEEYYKLPTEQQRPKLEKWFDVELKQKSVALFPFAGYSKEPKRSPSINWYRNLLWELESLDYHVYHFGHYNEPYIGEEDRNKYTNLTNLPFFTQIQTALGCDFTIGTDSGTALVMGAYEIPQISLLTNHWPGHTQNPLAFSTNNPNNQSLFSENRCDNIKIEDVLSAIKNI